MVFALDNNVLVSSLLFKGSVPNVAFIKAVKKGVLLASHDTFEELADVLLREKFDRYVDIETRIELLINFKSSSQFVEIKEKITVCRDPKDDMYLELALSGKANAIITGDKDLLDLHPFRGIDIITPKEFIDRTS